MQKTLFIVDDDLGFRELLSAVLARDYSIRTFAEPAAMLRVMEKSTLKELPALVLSDFTMPAMNGRELTEAVKAKYPQVPVIVMTGYGTIDNAVAVLKAGAFHYMEKNSGGTVSSTNFTILKELIKRAIDAAEAKEATELYKSEVETLKTQVKRLRNTDLAGDSAAIKSVRLMIEQVALIDSTVLVRGETGTGKNLAAEQIHQLSSRDRTGRFVEINCAALPETLLEAELFGYEQGAFTDARSQKKGLFEVANGGTIFLDEVDSTTLLVQSKLLSVLESRSFRRVGGNEPITVDVRLICATNASLEKKVADGRFREDLFYRINVVTISMPPLRELGNDVILIADRFAAKFSREMKKVIDGLSPAAAAKLLSHPWKGNVRELRNVIERAVIFTPNGQAIDAEQIVLTSVHPSAAVVEMNGNFTMPVGATMEDIKLAYVRAVLKKCDNKYSDAAAMLDISQKSLWEIRRRYGLD
ncbi:MAG: sigma-54-dependent Fis family transcriptional regulator [Rhizobacter sp.]|nr:sigma-54-dependent Fis family transcriptional regulator [Chlorobiales bacterium]